MTHDDLKSYFSPIVSFYHCCMTLSFLDCFVGLFFCLSGVSGFRNSSYTLLAHMDTTFSSALTLLEGQPQTGYVESHSYVYYKFYISDSDEARLIGSISIALTSLQGRCKNENDNIN